MTHAQKYNDAYREGFENGKLCREMRDADEVITEDEFRTAAFDMLGTGAEDEMLVDGFIEGCFNGYAGREE